MKRNIKNFLALALGCVIAVSSLSQPVDAAYDFSQVTSQNLDYTDSLRAINNPDIGFYRPRAYHLKSSENTVLKPSGEYQLVHLLIDLSEFSSNASLSEDTYGTDAEISEDALAALSDTLSYIRSQNKNVVVRSCYDYYYNGNRNYEPSMELILRHIQQLAEVYNQYTDVITYVELGTFGPWGEMHSSSCCTNENVSLVLQKALDTMDPKIKIGVRKPTYIASWLGIVYGKFDGVSEEYQTAVLGKEADVARVGLYNDGYLGSSSDLGTFHSSEVSRENALSWFENQCTYLPYGGEVAANSSGGIIGDFNKIEYIAQEAFQTHTSFLNVEWNNNVIDAWKQTTYTNSQDEYNNRTGFEYVRDHMGYRFVLRDSKLTQSLSDRSLQAQLKIENVGFGNVTRDKATTVVLESSTGDYKELAVDALNAKELFSGQVTTVSIRIPLSAQIADGTYKVYLKFSDEGDETSNQNRYCIQFANTQDYWKPAIGANYIGEIIVETVTETPTPTATATVSPSETQVVTATVPPTATTSEFLVEGDQLQFGVTDYEITKIDGTTVQVTVTGADKDLTKLTIPDSFEKDGTVFNVTKIADQAFIGCKNLKSVTIGANIQTIGKKAFYKCEMLGKITIKSKQVKKVGSKAFCKIKKSAVIKTPKGMTKKYQKLLKKKCDKTVRFK